MFFVEFDSPAVQKIAAQQVTIPNNQATQYKIFDTAGLASGRYSVNVRLQDGARLRSDSRLGNTVTITGIKNPATSMTTQAVTTTKTPILTTTMTPAATPMITVTRIVTSVATPDQTVIISTIPTKSVEDLLSEQNKKLDEQNRLIAEQNKKIESQNDLLNQILTKFKSVFGWN